jgi:threonine/homoserine efflux transporter RhtA
MNVLPMLGRDLDPSECIEGLCAIAPFSLFRATSVIALGWAILLGSLLVATKRRRAKLTSTIWTLPLLPIVILLWQNDPARDLNLTGGVIGWIWGLTYAWYVRRALRPGDRADAPIEGLGTPWDLARVAFGIALAAPLLGPVVAGLLAAPFD